MDKLKELKIAEELGCDDINPLEIDTTDIDKINFDSDNPKMGILGDYKYIRKRALFNMEVCKAILNESLKDVIISNNSRMLDAISLLIKTSNDTGKEIISIHEKIKNLIDIIMKEDKELNQNDKNLKSNMSEILNAVNENEKY